MNHKLKAYYFLGEMSLKMINRIIAYNGQECFTVTSKGESIWMYPVRNYFFKEDWCYYTYEETHWGETF